MSTIQNENWIFQIYNGRQILKFYIYSFLILTQAVEAQKKFGNAKAISSDQFFEGQKFDVSASFYNYENGH